MITTLTGLALAPVLICLFYIYIRDKYEHEPWRLLAVGVVAGAVIAVPVMRTAGFAVGFMPVVGQFGEAVYTSFIAAGLVEEGFKFIALFFLIWHNRNMNEPMDGIVYAVFVSLGFAGVENMLYALHPTMGGMGTAFGRAIVSVPAHGIFGVLMGYYFALAKFEPRRRKQHMVMAFIAPIFIHGVYNTLLLAGHPLLIVIFVPLLVWMWVNGHKKINAHLKSSPFKKTS